ncbi:hypothetical protein ERO13_A13G219000v2 [Gossypium hirsutum]|uniref:AT-hook motif nuclear-localized protein 17 n=2 Tax=Gossypium TaxID=3633 RepID=A0A1U8MRW2_GOSHI|nr:AT-hook motif nuclear-localized protein 17-like [Gossypium hirsutum]KAG4167807.1 hypothetical protein ERO13_A13G219000v2 [Gossypium hirsutum]TYH93538.1 hypothetical protein ES332_A13G261500v1 [Gossypium tomentosum]
MADMIGVISLSQAPNYSSDDDSSSENTPLSGEAISGYVGANGSGGDGSGSSKSKTPTAMVIDDHHPQPRAPPSSGATARKPRGRPVGSRNRPKPAAVTARDGGSAVVQPAVLEITAGADIIETIISFARRNRVGVSVVSATGSVMNVTLRHPLFNAPSFSLHGSYGLLAMSGSFMAFSGAPSSSNRTPQSTFGVTLAGTQGQLSGGLVWGRLMVATEATLVLNTFVNPALHRQLPFEVEDRRRQDMIMPSLRGNNGAVLGGLSSLGGSLGVGVGSGLGGLGGGGLGLRGAVGGGATGFRPVYGVAAVPPPMNGQSQMFSDVMQWGPSPRPY